MTDTRPTRWTALLNPAAGRGRASARLTAVTAALAASPLDVDVHHTTSDDDLRTAAATAFGAGRGVVACGGDGTVSLAAGVAADHDGVIAVVPTGSGNDLARHLGIPRDDPAAAVDLIAHGVVARIDLGRVECADGTSALFTTVANTGFDAEANRWANTRVRLTGTPLYLVAVLRTLRSYRPQRVRISVDGATTETDAWLVAVANTRSYASGMVIAPAASTHDGLLDVCVVGAVSRPEFLRTFPGVFRGTHVRHPLVTMLRGRDVTISSTESGESVESGDWLDTNDDDVPRAPLEMWASGERVGPLPVRVTAEPAALRVVVAGGTPLGLP